MIEKIIPSAKAKRGFWIHAIIFLIGSTLMLSLYDYGATQWTYPWPAWIVASWGLALFAHACVVFYSIKDPWLEKFNKMSHDMED